MTELSLGPCWSRSWMRRKYWRVIAAAVSLPVNMADCNWLIVTSSHWKERRRENDGNGRVAPAVAEAAHAAVLPPTPALRNSRRFIGRTYLFGLVPAIVLGADVLRANHRQC